jgi:alcohol dehydrogenase
MRAIVYDGRARLDENAPEPAVSPGEALVKVRLAGICNTDLEIVRGYMDYRGTLGHEFVGEVVGTSETGWIGRRVVGEINAPCGECATCSHVSGNHCPYRTVLGIAGRNGTFAELLALPLANLHKVPDSVSDEMAVFTEPLAAAFQILEQIQVRPTDTVLVLGDGKLGQLVSRVLRLTGAEVLAAGRHPSKLNLLTAAGIATALTTDLPDTRYDVVVDCTGSSAGFQEAMRRTRPRGTLVLKSTVADAANLNLAPVVIDEIHVVGSRCGPFEPALRALSTGAVDVRPLLNAIHPLDQGLEAMDAATKPGVLKVALRP